MKLQELNKNCRLCQLRQHCNGVITGVGDSNVNVMIVATKPSREEDILDVGFASDEAESFKLKLRQHNLSFYSTYLIKCFSIYYNNNKYAKICQQWLKREIDEIKPKVIICLGTLPFKFLTNVKQPLKKTLGKCVKSLDTLIVSWYSLTAMYNGGKKIDEDTKNMLELVVKYINKQAA